MWRTVWKAVGIIDAKCIECVASQFKILMWEVSSSIVPVHINLPSENFQTFDKKYIFFEYIMNDRSLF